MLPMRACSICFGGWHRGICEQTTPEETYFRQTCWLWENQVTAESHRGLDACLRCRIRWSFDDSPPPKKKDKKINKTNKKPLHLSSNITTSH